MLRLLSVLVLVLTFGVGQMWANYTITFKTSGSSSDGSGAQTTIANLISDGGGYVNSISASRAYNGKNGTGVKLGYGSGGGNVEMTMKSSGTNIGQIKATKLVVTATQYSNTENNLKVTVTYTTGSTPTEETLTLSSTSTPYDVTLDATKTIQKIKIETNSTKKRAYCASIQVVEASSKTLSSISVSTAPKTKYLAGETFDPTGLVITRTYSDASSDTYAYAGHTSDFTFSPTTSIALTTSHTSVSISYGGKSTPQAINVYNVTMQARDEEGNAIPAGGPGAPSRSGKSISPADDANNYVFKEWQVTNADLGSSATTKANTITNPTEAVTVTAVYYKPITITYKANGQDFTTQTYGYGGTLAFPASGPNGDTYSCTGKTFTGWVAEANKDYSNASTAPTYVTAGGSVTTAATYYAVFATASTGGTPTFEGYEKVTSAPDDWTTDTYVIATADDGYVLNGKADGGDYGAEADMDVDTETTSWEISIINKGDGKYALQQGDKYLAITSNGNSLFFVNSYSAGTTEVNNCDWNIFAYGDGYSVRSTVKMTQKSATDYRVIKDNHGSTRFAGYVSGQTAAYLYRKVVSGGGTSYSNFETNCCSPLGSINGSFFWTIGKGYLTR